MSHQAISSKVCHDLLPKLKKKILHRDIDSVNKLHKNLQHIQKNFERYANENSDILNTLEAIQTEIAKK